MTISLQQIERVRPFSNGSQHADWEASNCERCTKNFSDEHKFRCDLQRAITDACWGDGSMPADVAARMGYVDPLAYVWQCGEVEWTPEWVAESKRRTTLRFRLRKWWHGKRVALRKWWAARKSARRMRYANRFADDRRTCWVDWVTWALNDADHPEQGGDRRCRADARRDGTCYCGKFTRDNCER